MLDGTPPIIANGGMSLVTTELAPIIALSPILHPGLIRILTPIQTSLPIITLSL